MASGLQISQGFIRDELLPLLQENLPTEYPRLAVAVIGSGSDVLGLDDDISRDHHWGPRANVLYPRAEEDRIRPLLQETFEEGLPEFYQDYEIQMNIGNMTGVCCCTIEDLFSKFLGSDQVPNRDVDWLRLCEVDLFHVTAGTIVYDGLGELTRRRDALSYYPDEVWKKRLADWCMYVTGREAPYNLHRVSKRGDDLTCTIYLGLCLKRLMELCFTLNRQYAPYTKWLNRTFRQLPKYADKLAPLIDEAISNSTWDQRVQVLIEANYVVAQALADLGLADPPTRREFDDQLTDLTLYDSAAQIYESLPKHLVSPSFNQIEHWEKMARDVLFDTNDYIHSPKNSHAGTGS